MHSSSSSLRLHWQRLALPTALRAHHPPTAPSVTVVLNYITMAAEIITAMSLRRLHRLRRLLLRRAQPSNIASVEYVHPALLSLRTVPSASPLHSATRA